MQVDRVAHPRSKILGRKRPAFLAFFDGHRDILPDFGTELCGPSRIAWNAGFAFYLGWNKAAEKVRF